MGIKISGFDELSKDLKNLKKNISKIRGVHKVSFEELFSKQFMLKYTNFSTIDEMFENSGFKLESNVDFDAIPVLRIDSFVSRVTKFKNWDEMKTQAGSEYSAKLTGKAFDESF